MVNAKIPDSIPPRCTECARMGVYNRDTGEVRCYRNYPPVAHFIPNCKIDVWNGRKKVYIDAFYPRASRSVDEEEVLSLQEKLSLDDKVARAKAMLNKFVKRTEKKGSTITAGIASEVNQDMLTFRRRPTGIPSFDGFLGDPISGEFGPPIGAIMTLTGEKSVGKTSLMLSWAAEVQRQGGLPLFADPEGSLDMRWAAKLGVDPDKMVVLISSLGPKEEFTVTALEDYCQAVLEAVNSGIYDIMFMDSLDALIARGDLASKKGVTRDLDDDNVALKARQFSKWYPQIAIACRSRQISMVQVAQVRTKGIGSAFVFNDMSGGNALIHHQHLRIDLARGPATAAPLGSDGVTKVGFQLKMKIKKAKIYGIVEGSKMDTAFFFDRGFSPLYEAIMISLSDVEGEGLLWKKSTAITEYIDSTGETHSIRGSKPAKIMEYIEAHSLADDFMKRFYGDVEPGKKGETDNGTTKEVESQTGLEDDIQGDGSTETDPKGSLSQPSSSISS